MTADVLPVFCATSGVVMPFDIMCDTASTDAMRVHTCASLPSPCPAFQPIFCIILAAAESPPAGAGGGCGATSTGSAVTGAASARILHTT